AVLVRPQYYAHYQSVGTLAAAPMGSGATRELLENVFDADWSPDGSELAVIDRDHGKWRLQYPIGKVLLETENWISDLRVSPDGTQIALFRHPPQSIDDRGDVLLIDRSGNTRVLSAGWEALEGLAWSPSGKEVWFSGAESSDQYCIRAVSLPGKLRTIYCGTAASRIHDIAPSGRALLSAEEGRQGMGMVEHGASEERDITWLDDSDNPRISADGSKVLFTDYSEHAGKDYAAYIRNSDGSPAIRIGGGGSATDITPDGKWALVVMSGDPSARIQVVPVGAGQAHALHWDGVQPDMAHWFPDGQHILFIQSRQSGGAAGLYMTDTNGSTPKLVASGILSWLVGPSPDGQTFLIPQNGAWVIG
ncbi:MAG: hypothetical protein ABSD20_08205, partial [Terriglobales bacterium]